MCASELRTQAGDHKNVLSHNQCISWVTQIFFPVAGLDPIASRKKYLTVRCLVQTVQIFLPGPRRTEHGHVLQEARLESSADSVCGRQENEGGNQWIGLDPPGEPPPLLSSFLPSPLSSVTLTTQPSVENKL